MTRPAIPEPIKRQVRQECSFGCVICGCPVFDYDHIIPYATVKEHKPENLTLLCKQHHSDKTTKKLSVERVIEARKQPYNSRKKIIGSSIFSTSYILPENRKIEVFLGSNKAQACFLKGDGDVSAVWISGQHYFIIHCQDNWITFSCILTDGIGQPILIIDQGEMTLSTQVWDYTYQGNNLKIWIASREIILDMNLSNHFIKINKGCFMYSDYGFVIDSGSMLTIKKGQVCGVRSGGTYRSAAFGIIGLLNHKDFPRSKKPGNFVSLQEIRD